ncbi:MAG: hypothetical protein ABSF49_11430, partial [Roseiarcus sp.]|uniref:hypothetical protein n=1 Tax=Roseiarcus sp. TaxID=1969460 RepID=UPI003C18546E
MKSPDAGHGFAFGDLSPEDGRRLGPSSFSAADPLSVVMAGLVPRLSGSIFLGKAHGIDSNHFQSLATRLDMKGISAVPHTNT